MDLEGKKLQRDERHARDMKMKKREEKKSNKCTS